MAWKQLCPLVWAASICGCSHVPPQPHLFDLMEAGYSFRVEFWRAPGLEHDTMDDPPGGLLGSIAIGASYCVSYNSLSYEWYARRFNRRWKRVIEDQVPRGSPDLYDVLRKNDLWLNIWGLRKPFDAQGNVYLDEARSVKFGKITDLREPMFSCVKDRRDLR